jgi:ribokinase
MDSGENAILLVGGANMDFGKDFTFPQAWVQAIEQSCLLLLQREIPESVCLQAARIASKSQVKVVLDLGGRDDPVSSELIGLCDVISPNEVSPFFKANSDQD